MARGPQVEELFNVEFLALTWVGALVKDAVGRLVVIFKLHNLVLDTSFKELLGQDISHVIFQRIL